MRRSPFPAFSKDRVANAAIEFSLILPAMLLIFGGIVEFGRAFQVYGAVNRLATRYALAWADCSDNPPGTCDTELSMYTAAASIQNLVPQLTDPVVLRMMQVTMAGSSASVTDASPSGATLTSSEFSVAQGVIPAGQVGVVVTVTYTHTLSLFKEVMTPFMGASRTITYTVAQLKR